MAEQVAVDKEKVRNGGDPTANVLDLVDAAVRRQDDLRAAEKDHVAEVLRIRDEWTKERVAREAERIDAIRQVDVQAVQQAATVAATQATTLAAQVATSAETLRTQVAAAASAATIALAAALEPVQKDIADLRRAQYEAQGQKTQVVETQAKGTSTGMWVGVALAAASLFVTNVLAIAAIVSVLTG
jgi:hypothetical protein